MKNLNLKLDVYSDISFQENDKGKKIPHAYHAVFANGEDPALEIEVPIKDMLAKYIDNNVIPGGTVTEKMRYDVLEDLSQLKEIIEKAIHQVEKMPDVNQAKSKKAKPKT